MSPASGEAPTGTQQNTQADLVSAFSQEPDFVVCGSVNGSSAKFLIDTGAAVTVISAQLWEAAKQADDSLNPIPSKKLLNVSGDALQLKGMAAIQVKIAGLEFNVNAVVVQSLAIDAVLGRDFLRKEECTIELRSGKDVLHFGKQGATIDLQQRNFTLRYVNVILPHSVTIPPCSEIEVMGIIPEVPYHAGSWLLEGAPTQKGHVRVARAIVDPKRCVIPLRLLNLKDNHVSIPRNQTVATIEPLPVEPATIDVAGFSESEEEVSDEKRENLRTLANSVTGLTSQEKAELFELLLEYANLFAWSLDDFGRTSKIKHRINTGQNQPIRQQARRIPPAKRDEVQSLLDQMLEKEVIQRSASPWASPVVLVKKKDGSTRFCVDYRKVNNVTRKDAYPIPRIDDSLDTLAGAKWFTTLDLISGYWQVEVEETDKEKTAFSTPCGLFEFNVMPFGLCNAPATFQRLMELVLAGLQWKSCLVYLDDVIIVGSTFDEHLTHLRAVLNRIRDAGLKLKPAKCNFCCQQVDFLGHVVSASGVQPDLGKVEKVSNWPTPSNKKEVQQFLGLASYYRRFVQNFATIAKPLHRLTEKTARFAWTDQAQHAFDSLKQSLSSAPILAFPDFQKPFILDTDASDTGLGGVLSQAQDDGSECVVAYASRVLTRPERRYCVTRRELLAVVTFTRHFRPYLLGRSFTIRTDHGSLTWLSNMKDPEGQLARWLEQLQEFNFTIVHRAGRKHSNADALSRRPCTQCGREESAPDTICATTQHVCPTPPAKKSPEQLRQLQLDDPAIGFILVAKEASCKPSKDQARGKGPAAQRMLQLWDRLHIQDRMLVRDFEDNQGHTSWTQLLLPKSLTEEVMQELHAGATEGHLGEEKTLLKIKERFYWPGMQQDVHNWCQTCATCATRKTAPKKNIGPLETIETGFPMQVVAVDILGPLPESTAGNCYVLVAADYFTKWVETYAIPNQEAVTVAKKLTEQMFCRFSPPDQLHSDQGRQFESKLLQEICKIFHIKKTRTTPYHPQCDGQVERFNRTLLHMLSTTLKDYPCDWEERLPKVCMAYNTSVHASTGYSPFYLMFGRKPKLPIDLLYPTKRGCDTTVSEYANDLRSSLETAFERVRHQLQTKHKQRKEYYDKKVHGDPYCVDDMVWLHSTTIPKGGSKKFHHPWSGPYRVVTKITDNDYRIESSDEKKRTLVVHFNRLKRCVPGTRFSHPPADTADQPSQVRTTPYRCGERIEIVEALSPDTGRYPSRERRPPDRLVETISTVLEFETNSPREEDSVESTYTV